MLREIADGVWDATEPLQVMGFNLGHRMTVIRFENGEIAIHSPIHISSAVQNDLKEIGPVKYILAPSAMHDLHLKEWMDAYPSALLLHSPALNINRIRGIDTQRARPLTSESVHDLQVIPIEGMPRIQESVFLHGPSGILIVCDLVFNLSPGRGIQKLLQQMSGIYERVGPSRFFKAYISHDSAFRDSIIKILGMNFDRLVVGHGSNVDSRAKEHLQRAFAWLRLPETGGK